MRFMFACGGTGGHINPAIAVAKLVKEKRKDAEILFVGVEGGMETRLVPAAGFQIKTIVSKSISRKFGLKALLGNIDAVRHIITAEMAAKKIIENFSPDIVMGTGGYACYPFVLAAAKKKIPTVIHESNAYPGLATRALSKRVDRVLLNFDAGQEHLSKRAICKVVGNPVRGDILMYDREKARQELGIAKPLLVSFWGSLGAREMNKHIAEFIKLEADNSGRFHHIHATGKFGYKWMPELIRELGVDLSNQSFIVLREYIDDMPRVLAAADVVMCRGGASTLSEIHVTGKPAIIVPSPNVTNNHQFKNASELEKIGGAVLVEEKNVTASLLYDTAVSLLGNEEKCREMSEKLHATSVLDAAERIYSEMISIIRK